MNWKKPNWFVYYEKSPTYDPRPANPEAAETDAAPAVIPAIIISAMFGWDWTDD